jgi:hypothetical protein
MHGGLRLTSRGVPRAARPDGTRDGTSFVVKNTRHLRLTYQIFLLTMQAQNDGTTFVIVIARDCRLSDDLQWFLDHNDGVLLQRVDR